MGPPGRRGFRRTLLLSALTGAVTGLGVAGFEWIVHEGLFATLRRQPPWVQASGPLVGLLLAAAALRWLAAGATSSTSDEYIKNFHDREQRLPLRPVAGRMVASVATLGFGAAMGYEGPSIYLGASIGSALQRRFSRLFSRDDAKLLLVAGAAAGVSAIFKAPATGVVFALEVPYQDDVARGLLLPAALASAVSYITYAAFFGTTPLLPVRGAPPFDLVDVGGAIVLGLLSGAGARGFAVLLVRAKAFAARSHPIARAAAGGVAMAALAAGAWQLFGDGLTLGPGYNALRFALDPKRSVALIVALLMLRAVATAACVAGGGAGGLFVPLVIEGALLGRALGALFQTGETTLFPLIGMAAFLGAGYRVPLAAVMFVAESTGRPGFVVPGLIAAVVAQLVMGRGSVSPYQAARRAGHLERRFSLPLSAALKTDVMTMPPDTTVSEFFWQHLVGTKQKAVAVVDGNTYLGLARIEELSDLARDAWETTEVAAIMRDDLPAGRPGWSVRDAIRAMEAADIDRMAIVDEGNAFVGMVSTSDIIALDEILGQATGDQP